MPACAVGPRERAGFSTPGCVAERTPAAGSLIWPADAEAINMKLVPGLSDDPAEAPRPHIARASRAQTRGFYPPNLRSAQSSLALDSYDVLCPCPWLSPSRSSLLPPPSPHLPERNTQCAFPAGPKIVGTKGGGGTWLKQRPVRTRHGTQVIDVPGRRLNAVGAAAPLQCRPAAVLVLLIMQAPRMGSLPRGP